MMNVSSELLLCPS